MNYNKYIKEIYEQILKHNNININRKDTVFLYFDNDIMIYLLAKYLKNIQNIFSYLKNLNEDKEYIYDFSDLYEKDSSRNGVNYCVYYNDDLRQINNNVHRCERCTIPCYVIKININDFYKYFNKLFDQNVGLR